MIETVVFESADDRGRWLSGEAKKLAREQRDVALFAPNGTATRGSMHASLPAIGQVVVLSYDRPSQLVPVSIHGISRVKVSSSRRLTPREAYAQMRAMESALLTS